MNDFAKNDFSSENFSIRYSENRAEGHILEHYHDAFEIAFFVKANIQIFVKDSTFDIHDGDILFIDEYNIHRIIYNNDTYYARYVITLKKEYISNFLKVLNTESVLNRLRQKSVVRISLTVAERKEMAILFDMLMKSYKSDLEKNSPISRTSVKASLYMLLASLTELMDAKVSSERMDRKDIQVRQLIEFIDANYASSVTLDLLARRFYLSKFYISRIFKELTGFTLVEYIQHRRVIEAQKLLRQSDKDITRISYDCGFNSIQHFYLVFKRINKISPLKYRRSSKK